MSTFVLAHLSDPHLGPVPRPRVRDLAGKRAIGYAHWRGNRSRAHRGDVLEQLVADLKISGPDHIAVTGDLVNIALADEFAPARRWLDTLGSPRDVTVVPGNHDSYVPAAMNHLRRHWHEFLGGEPAGVNGAPFAKTEFPFVRRRGHVALIGLSSGVPTGPFLATGRLGRAQITRFAALLDQLREEGLFRVVMIHHPPVSKHSERLKRLVDAASFRATLKRHGAELVIHGHDHAHSRVYLDGPNGRIPAVGVPSASESDRGRSDPAAYNLYRIEGEPGAWRCEVISRGLARGNGREIMELSRATLESR